MTGSRLLLLLDVMAVSAVAVLKVAVVMVGEVLTSGRHGTWVKTSCR